MPRLVSITLLALLCCAGLNTASAEGRAMPVEFLHPLFSDHAVLQRDVAVPVWGTGPVGGSLTVSFGDQLKEVKVGDDGKWRCTLDPMPASFESRTLQVSNPQLNQADMATDVLVGDVWLCSGQSNMEMGLTRANEDAEIAAANHPNLRLLTIPHEVAYRPQDSFHASWRRCSPEGILEDNFGGFSAAAYFFGKQLQEELKIPIGLIHSSWGGTMIEAWMSMGALEPHFAVQGQLNQVRKIANSNDPKALDKMMDEWFQKHDVGTQEGWHKGTADTSTWRDVTMPGGWGDCGIKGFEGIVWMQREFEVPADWAGKAMVIQMGTIADTDTTWINGVEVGRTNSFEMDTEYQVAADLIKAGRNVITMRITNAGGGGIHDKDTIMSVSPLHITPKEAVHLAPILSGKWKLKTSAPKSKTGRPIVGNPCVPTVLYNGMIAPLAPCAMRGVIWYQGESNAGSAKRYAEFLPMMITEWRRHFNTPDLAFHIVSLANHMDAAEQPRNHAWAELREAQAMTAKQVPHCGLAVTIDIGDAADIHPKNKREVGRRLALSALAKTYGKAVAGSGPWYRGMAIEGDKLRLHFDEVHGGLVFKGESDKSFAIAGADGKFVWANAVIEGQSILVSSPQIKEPVAVRYAWDSNPQACLYNAQGLPAVPFRSER